MQGHLTQEAVREVDSTDEELERFENIPGTIDDLNEKTRELKVLAFFGLSIQNFSVLARRGHCSLGLGLWF